MNIYIPKGDCAYEELLNNESYDRLYVDDWCKAENIMYDERFDKYIKLSYNNKVLVYLNTTASDDKYTITFIPYDNTKSLSENEQKKFIKQLENHLNKFNIKTKIWE